MTKKLTIALALSLLASGSLSVLQPASAQNWRDVVRDVVTGNSYDNGYGNRYDNRFDNRFENRNNSSDLRFRADRIERRLQAALDNGQLSQRRFSWLSSRLSDVQSDIMRSRGFGNRGDITARLNEIDANLRSSVATRGGRMWY